MVLWCTSACCCWRSLLLLYWVPCASLCSCRVPGFLIDFGFKPRAVRDNRPLTAAAADAHWADLWVVLRWLHAAAGPTPARLRYSLLAWAAGVLETSAYWDSLSADALLDAGVPKQQGSSRARRLDRNLLRELAREAGRGALSRTVERTARWVNRARGWKLSVFSSK